MGSSAPDLPAQAKVINLEQRRGQSFSMICSAQASPTPSYR